MSDYGTVVMFCLWMAVAMMGLFWFAEVKVRPYERAGMVQYAWVWVARGIIFQVTWLLLCLIIIV